MLCVCVFWRCVRNVRKKVPRQDVSKCAAKSPTTTPVLSKMEPRRTKIPSMDFLRVSEFIFSQTIGSKKLNLKLLYFFKYFRLYCPKHFSKAKGKREQKNRHFCFPRVKQNGIHISIFILNSRKRLLHTW